jgi:ElaB/YqjD/DUF883 family membrane-anchored ribosome-binding protein
MGSSNCILNVADCFAGKEASFMARTSKQTAEKLQVAYDRSKDFIGTVTQESRAAYEEARQWVPKHPTAVAVSASVAFCAGAFGYVLGRQRRAQADRSSLSTALERAPEIDLGPFFRFVKIWMLYRIAAKA